MQIDAMRIIDAYNIWKWDWLTKVLKLIIGEEHGEELLPQNRCLEKFDFEI